ncbi:hypothetical protein BB050_03526 [Flavobacterium anhuiense]|uniref:Alpha-L-rhamnosidase six-hairpin glycosidase domain-containing protein n=1 Tax=Flavobacterium anhuiense TaxID=459526 RepID=A0AAC9GJF7_9FLAO|nr:hypothetical protein [Flavobacterium anhuiense]AOC96615.1 hypothetical protein BB050_03526 [Flavobacterium anhuiense]
MKNHFIVCVANCCFFLNSFSQETITFRSTDPTLQLAFERAKSMALSYKGDSNDPVGPWYEAALPSRSAFCMRDVSHQSIGAEILGLSKENKNMLSLFAKNISESKDWCSYWEINKYGKPAPEDYRNDKEFWYNLNSNFDVIFACWRLYLWTGDEDYIKNPEFENFFEKSSTAYIERWFLEADSLLTRPEFVNTPTPFDSKDDFHKCRGLASYSEGIPGLKMGVDLVAAIYRGLLTYSSILKEKRQFEKAAFFEKKALRYQEQIEQIWWDQNASAYNVIYTADGKFSKDAGELFLLWFDVLADTDRTEKTIKHILSEKSNVENASYLPFLLYKYGYEDKAYEYILHLTDPETKRREYPEVSYGVIEGIIHGCMGIEPDASKKTITTIHRGKKDSISEVDNLPVLQTTLAVKHEKQTTTTLHNKGEKFIEWKAMFPGNYTSIFINNKKAAVIHEKDNKGNPYTAITIRVNPGQKITAACR